MTKTHIEKMYKKPQDHLYVLIFPTVYFLFLYKYTNDILNDPKCDCVVKDRLLNIQNFSKALFASQIGLFIMLYFKVLEVSVYRWISLVPFVIHIVLILQLKSLIDDIHSKKCKCADNVYKTIIFIYVWINIIFWIILVTLILFGFLLDNKF